MQSGLIRSVLPLIAFVVPASDHAGEGARASVSVVDSTLATKRLRIGGKMGDLMLRGGTATLVVRAADGVLVDFWPHDDRPASVPQLQGLRGMDGLWQFNPELFHGSKHYPLETDRVIAADESIETVIDVSLANGSLRVTTSFRIDPKLTRLLVRSTLLNTGASALRDLDLGNTLRWGGVEYEIEGVGRAEPSFEGRARWIGRRGAAGDLRLVTLQREPMFLRYRMNHPGVAPIIHVRYGNLSELAPGEQHLVERIFAYEPFSAPARREGTVGTLHATIVDDRGQPLASKLTLRGQKGTPDPDFGNDGDETGASRFVWSGTGRFERTLPPGSYKVLATAGPERDAASFLVDIVSGEAISVDGQLRRVVPTPGWISADLHLHQAPSIDADIAYDTRVISVAAEGVEFAVATDHFVVTDLAPTVEHLTRSGRLSAPFRTMIGGEVSTFGSKFGHFNVFPLALGQVVDGVDTTPRQLFADLRRASPRGIIQVNHPRWSKAYFNYYDMDLETGRIPETRIQEYSADFDALEVFNGLDISDPPHSNQVLKDWLHQLDHGHRHTATGNSDSHQLFFSDPGLPRNMIQYGAAQSDEDDLRAGDDAILGALRAGRVVVTSGPMLAVDIDGHGPGSTVVSTQPVLPLRIHVRAAPWIDVRTVTILSGTKTQRFEPIVVAPSRALSRLDRVVAVPGDIKTYYVVTASGDDPLPNTHHGGIVPFAFSNPIWVVPALADAPRAPSALP